MREAARQAAEKAAQEAAREAAQEAARESAAPSPVTSSKLKFIILSVIILCTPVSSLHANILNKLEKSHI